MVSYLTSQISYILFSLIFFQQAFEGPDIFDRQSLEDDVVEAKVRKICIINNKIIL